MQVTGCEHCRWVGPERRPEGRLGEEAGDCSHCGRPMLWMTEWDAQVLGVQSSERGRLAIENGAPMEGSGKSPASVLIAGGRCHGCRSGMLRCSES